jgi:hypothetical protein
MTRIALAILVASSLLPGMSHAQDAVDADVRIDFESVDSNNDGYITRDELPADHPLLVQFESLDTNGDERLSPDELKDNT